MMSSPQQFKGNDPLLKKLDYNKQGYIGKRNKTIRSQGGRRAVRKQEKNKKKQKKGIRNLERRRFPREMVTPGMWKSRKLQRKKKDEMEKAASTAF